LATGGIAANCGFRLPNLPFPWGDRGPCLIVLFGTTSVMWPNGISFCPTAFAGCTSVTDDLHTDRPRFGNVAIGGIAFGYAA